MGEGVSDINLAAQPPAVILMAGLQGAGKTTTTGKLARHLIEKRKKKVLTVSATSTAPPPSSSSDGDGASRRRMVPRLTRNRWTSRAALDYARKAFFDVLLVDTGRPPGH